MLWEHERVDISWSGGKGSSLVPRKMLKEACQVGPRGLQFT